MRKRTAIVGIIVLLVMLVGGILVSHNATAAGSDGKPHPIPPNNISAITYSPGVPAIAPSGTKHSEVTLTAGTAPSLTESDVRSYFAQGGYPHAAAGVHPSIVKVLFISAQQASTIMHDEFVDRPDNVTVCYVLLKGPFNFPYSHPYWPGATSQQLPENYVEEVFDAYSGNLLMWGIPANM